MTPEQDADLDTKWRELHNKLDRLLARVRDGDITKEAAEHLEAAINRELDAIDGDVAADWYEQRKRELGREH